MITLVVSCAHLVNTNSKTNVSHAQLETTLLSLDPHHVLSALLDILQAKEALTVPLALVVTMPHSATAIFVPPVNTLYLAPPHVITVLLEQCQPLEATAVPHLAHLAFTNKDKDALSRLTLSMIKPVEMALPILMALLLNHQESLLDSSTLSLAWSLFLS